MDTEETALQALNDLRLHLYAVFAPSFSDGVEEIGKVSFSDGLYPSYPALDIESGAGDYFQALFYDSSDNQEVDAGTYSLDPAGDAGTLGYVALMSDLSQEIGNFASPKVGAFSGPLPDFEAEFGVTPDVFVRIVAGSVTATKTGSLSYTLEWTFTTAEGETISGSAAIAGPN